MSFKNLPLLALGGFLLYQLSKSSPAKGTAAGGIEYLQVVSNNPQVVIKPATVTPAGFEATATGDVPKNIFQVTQDVFVSGATGPVVNIPGGQLVTTNELAWIDTKAQDEATRAAATGATSAAYAQETAYYAANVPVLQNQAAALSANSSGESVWFEAWAITGGDSRLMTDSLYQTLKRKYSQSVPLSKVIGFAQAINGAYGLTSWFASHKTVLGGWA